MSETSSFGKRKKEKKKNKRMVLGIATTNWAFLLLIHGFITRKLTIPAFGLAPRWTNKVKAGSRI
jgi:hypothetical protein